MKKKLLTTLIISSLALGLGAITGINNIKKSQDVKKADAAEITGTFSRQAAFYQSYTSDPSTQYISRSTMAQTATWGTNNFRANGNSLSLTINETAYSGDWHAIYIPFSYTLSLPAYSSVRISLPCNIATDKTTSGGQADHVAEIHYYDSVSYNSLVGLNLMVDKDNPSTTSIINTGYSGDYGAYRVYSRAAGSTSGSKTFTNTTTPITNYTDTPTTITLYFGFFGYIEQSSSNHQWNATLSINAAPTLTVYNASTTIGTTTSYYTNFSSALGVALGSSTGGTINIYGSETYTGGFYIDKNVTLYLNGYTLSRSDAATSLFGVAGDVKFNIIGGGGKVTANGNVCVIYVNAGGTLQASNVTIENTQSGTGCHVIQMNSGGGNLDLRNGTILKTSGGGSGIYTSSGGNVIKCHGVTTMTGTGPAINLRASTSSSKNTLYIGGTCVFGSYININNNAYTNLYSYCDGVNYSGSQVINLNYETLPNPNDVIFTMANNPEGTQTYTKFAVKNAPSYMCIDRSATDPSKAIYAYTRYNLTINKTNVEGGYSSYVVTYANDFTVTFTGTSNGFYALPSTIRVTIGGIVKTEGTDYTWNQSTGVLIIPNSKIIANIAVTITGVATNKKAVNDFVNAYMHMTDYTSNLGYCSDEEHHYYITAKGALLNLGSDCINEFRTNDAFASALARYLAWANANQDSNPFAQTSGTQMINSVNNNSTLIFVSVVLLSVVSSFAIMGFIYYKKKHQ